ncbi:MAG: uridine kinase family protein [Fimbriimonas sp.]
MSSVGIAIAGGSCSGKTTLAYALSERLDATLVRIDDYYHRLDHLTYDERCEVNFDHPDSIDSQRLIRDMAALLRGETIVAPRYDFTRHTLFAEGEEVVPKPIVIVEGLFSLCYPELAEMCQIRVFVDAPEDVCLQRRVERDVRERGRTPGEVVGRFESHVAPMYRAHVLPSGDLANVRVCGIGSIPDARDGVLARVPAIS